MTEGGEWQGECRVDRRAARDGVHKSRMWKNCERQARRISSDYLLQRRKNQTHDPERSRVPTQTRIPQTHKCLTVTETGSVSSRSHDRIAEEIAVVVRRIPIKAKLSGAKPTTLPVRYG